VDRAMVQVEARASMVCPWEEETMDLKAVAWTIWEQAMEEEPVEATQTLIRTLTVVEDLI